MRAKNDPRVISDLRKHLLSAFARMDEMDEVFHPWVVEDVWRMAELLDIDTSLVPTEGRALTCKCRNQ